MIGAVMRRPRSLQATAALFLSPMVLALAVVAVWPLARTIWFGFTDASLTAPADYTLVGLANYLEVYDGAWYGVLADPQWWQALRNTLVFAAASVTAETVLGVGMALVLNARFPGRGLVRAAVLVPWAIPTVVSAKMWAWMLHDQFGIINAGAMALGLIDRPMAWLASSDTAMLSVILVDVWKTTPFVALLTLAALQTVPRDCYEAARVDGIPPWRVFLHITLPLIRPALAVAVVFRLLDALRVFDVVYVMTGEAEATMTLSIHARQQLVQFQDMGYGSASATLLFLVIGLVTVAYLAVLRPDRAASGQRMAGHAGEAGG
ncbi:ABC transporter permease [Tistrella bauzanensis]|uniref:ABC transporter permease n=1 Tax=Tistrella bauzanensis TaxID=657419 RepID=A0ABQ1IKL0_9PROT|nr:sugar ABC transporter permease [Tistrella bauzanensis]GGB45547.1 ABC transporter permease [Tistrella bauzanensis]